DEPSFVTPKTIEKSLIMKKNKSQKSKSFLDILYIVAVSPLFFIVLSVIILAWFSDLKPSSIKSRYFEDYYNKTGDPRYEWTK
ncbi:MAG: hypothetical protein Q7T50_03360, partial [Candidatus Magasanikbacteria bacterium]|nr:hypothetical protein [Candidatus Magasanikbacteria bacterium]